MGWEKSPVYTYVFAKNCVQECIMIIGWFYVYLCVNNILQQENVHGDAFV